jgi:hypothetical protein
MSLPVYHVIVDGRGYAGESCEVEASAAGPGGGWSGARPRECSGIQFGSPVDIVGVRNLTSHLERIIRRIGESREIVIRRQG